ncbi:protein-disulfide reductase DsbD family protein, partial [Pirellulales bacterium]|nr:protein-disulfide reductase DsbD family protein [Pirellulales bacterium]
YHLYGSDLPRDGVSGIGRPTLLEVGNSASYSSAASAVTDKAAKTHVDETLGISLSLFPDGPVTLYLPIHFGSAPQEPVTIPVKLTYMACSDQRCHMPVEAVEQVLTVDPQAGNAEETSK